MQMLDRVFEQMEYSLVLLIILELNNIELYDKQKRLLLREHFGYTLAMKQNLEQTMKGK